MTDRIPSDWIPNDNDGTEMVWRFHERIERRDLRVARLEDLTSRYRRIVLTGADLDRGYPFARFAPSDHVKVYFPDPETGQITAYRETEDGEYVVDPPEGTPVRRDYTPRAWDAAARELTLDFVLHDHGVAGRWAQQAQVGDPLIVMGPRANWLLPTGYRHYLAAGDETAIPAIARILEEAPAGAQVTAVIEVEDGDDEQPLQPGPGVEATLIWVHRSTAEIAPSHLSALETSLRGLALPDDLAEPGVLYAFAAGEAGALKTIRRWFRRELNLDKAQVNVDGYWKRGVADHDHHVTDDDS